MFIIGEEEISALRAVIEKRRIIRYENESETELLEREWAAFVGTKHCLALNSGTSALICALAGLGIGPGDEVIVPGYTFIATAAAVLAVGAVPVIADIDATLTIDIASVEKNISPYTKAVIPVHMAGRPCNMDALMSLANWKGLAVVEDACQADGGSYRGKRLGSIGNAGAFSFNFYKIISAGEGGALVTDDRTIYTKALLKHDCGYTLLSGRDAHTEEFAGTNFRISELQSAVIRVQQERLEGILSALRKEQAYFREALSGDVSIAPSNDIMGDCATHLVMQFPSAEEAAAFIADGKRSGLPLSSPINTGKHVYSHWTSIMERRGSHHAGNNPFDSAQRKIDYTPDMLPQTLSWLSRSVYFGMNPGHREDEWASWAHTLRSIARDQISSRLHRT